MKNSAIFIIVFFIYSCAKIEDCESCIIDSPKYHMSSLLETNVFIVNIEEEKDMDIVPHLVINNKSSNLSLSEYIENRTIEMRGEIQTLHIGFSIPKEYSVFKLDSLIFVSQKHVLDLYPEYKGKLAINVKYSSKGNGWLILPPPPNLN